MSVFKKTLEAHEAAKRQAEKAVTDAAEKDARLQQQFREAFTRAIDDAAMPVFGEFVSDALTAGYAANVDLTRTNPDGTISVGVRFHPLPGKQLNVNASDECVYTIRGIPQSQKVEHVLDYDMRPDAKYRSEPTAGKYGRSVHAFGVPSINKKKIEEFLEEFMTKALKARSENP